MSLLTRRDEGTRGGSSLEARDSLQCEQAKAARRWRWSFSWWDGYGECDAKGAWTFKCPSAASRVRRAVRQFTRFVCASRVTSATPRATVDGTTDPTARSVVTGSGMPTRAVREIRERRAAGADSGHATPRPPSRAGETESVASGDDGVGLPRTYV